MLTTTPDGPVTTQVHAMTVDRTVWFVGYMNTFAVFGVVLNMATKPSLLLCIVDITVGAAVGALLALFGLTRAASVVMATT
jgi:hypothetical protein